MKPRHKCALAGIRIRYAHDPAHHMLCSSGVAPLHTILHDARSDAAMSNLYKLTSDTRGESVYNSRTPRNSLQLWTQPQTAKKVEKTNPEILERNVKEVTQSGVQRIT